MMIKTNYHTHCTFCDGKNTAEEMALTAIQKKFHILGFSSHSMYPFSSDWHIACHRFQEYLDEIARLKRVYGPQMTIYAGFEADYIQGVCKPSMKEYAQHFSLDYLIGSVHFVPGNGGYFEADGSFAATREKIQSLYGGNIQEAVHAYFECQRKMLEDPDFTFMGHPDLIRKQNSPLNTTGPWFSEDDSWYKQEVDATAKAIAKSGVCVEVNTGGMARGYLDSPYPSPYFLEKLQQYGVPVTLNSDSHATDTLDFWFDEGLQYIKKAGYTEIMLYDAGSLKSQKLEM